MLIKNVAAFIDEVHHVHKMLTHLYRQRPIMSSRYGAGSRMTLLFDAFSNFAGVLKDVFHCCNAAGLLFAQDGDSKLESECRVRDQKVS